MASERIDAPPHSALGLWLRNLLCLLVPLACCVHLATGPHRWEWTLVSLVGLFSIDGLERLPWVERSAPPADLPGAPFTALLYVLAALQLANVTLLCWRLEGEGLSPLLTFDAVVTVLWCAMASSGSIVLAHELVHRPRAHHFQLARLLLVTVLYEHFATEHVRGHHVRVGTPADPATAQLGERFWPFMRRTVPAQLASAFELERRRLGLEDAGLLSPLWLRHRVVQGIVVEVAILAGMLTLLGPAALVGFALQALLAVVSLEAVNYFEHWGLERSGGAVEAQHSWDCDAWFTQYALVGLSRHADHHRRVSTPYQQLELLDGAPMLPASYGVMVELAIFQNAKFQRLMTEELGRKGLLAAPRPSHAPRATKRLSP